MAHKFAELAVGEQPWISTIWRCIFDTMVLAPPVANFDITANCANRTTSVLSLFIGLSSFGALVGVLSSGEKAPPRKGDTERNQDPEDRRDIEAQDSDGY